MRYATAIAVGLAFVFATACGTGTEKRATATPSAISASATARATATPGTASQTATIVAASETPASGTKTPAPGLTTGIRGLVTIGPTCPVERADSPCPDRPYEATIQVLDTGGNVVTEVRSDADGRFEVELPAGTYTLHPVTGSTPPSARDQQVTVRQGEVTEVAVQFDSGIR